MVHLWLLYYLLVFDQIVLLEQFDGHQGIRLFVFSQLHSAERALADSAHDGVVLKVNGLWFRKLHIYLLNLEVINLDLFIIKNE